jgi:predicted component of type VI protein secretion system
MTAPKTTSAARVEKLRAARDALGLKRLELYAHPEDWRAIKALAEKLARKRAKPVRSAPPSPPLPPR